jgi:hypothetical protein
MKESQTRSLAVRPDQRHSEEELIPESELRIDSNVSEHSLAWRIWANRPRISE